MVDDELLLFIWEFDEIATHVVLRDEARVVASLRENEATFPLAQPVLVGTEALAIKLPLDVDVLLLFGGSVDAELLLERTAPLAAMLFFEETVLAAVELVLEEVALLSTDTLFERAVLAAVELLFEDGTAVEGKELFLEETVVVNVEVLLKLDIEVTTELLFELVTAAAVDKLILHATSAGTMQLLFAPRRMSVGTVGVLLETEATEGTAAALFPEGSVVEFDELPVLGNDSPDDNVEGLVLGADESEFVIEVFREDTTALDSSTVRTGEPTEITSISETGATVRGELDTETDGTQPPAATAAMPFSEVSTLMGTSALTDETIGLSGRFASALISCCSFKLEGLGSCCLAA